MFLFQRKQKSSSTPDFLEQSLVQENVALQQELEWRKGAFSLLSYYTQNICQIANEHPGKVAIAVFSCVPSLPFNPFDSALNVQNEALSAVEQHRWKLAPEEDWFGRFTAYYSNLSSHLLDIYKNKMDEQGKPLAAKDRPTLTGVMSDQNSPVFRQVLESKQVYRTFLSKEQYGADLIVRVFPVFDENRSVIGMISFTHDITVYLEQQEIISTGLQQVQESAGSMIEQVKDVQEVSVAIQDFSAGIETLEDEMCDFTARVSSFQKTLLKSIQAIKILSINAGIEATRAGEQGKGFVVISSEIKRLTQDMIKAVAEFEHINEQINDIEKNSVNKLKQINGLAQQINHVADDLKEESINYESLLKTIASADRSYRKLIQTMSEE